MNNPDDLPLDIAEIRDWANGYRESNNYSWGEFSKITGIAAGTLQPWCKGTYAGPGAAQAKLIFRFRQTVSARVNRSTGMPKEPFYFETPTSRRIEEALIEAQMGDMSVVATAPGTGKTRTAENYANCNTPVWFATMSSAVTTLNQMLWEIAKAIGQPLKFQHSHGASRLIADMVCGRNGLLIIDEAGFLDLKAIEWLRALNDMDGGPGIAMLGNEELLARIEGGQRRDQFARLNSRIGNRLIQSYALEADVVSFCDAWGVDDGAMRTFLIKIATMPASGGLRDCRKLVKKARLLALHDGHPLALSHLRDANSTRATRHVRA